MRSQTSRWTVLAAAVLVGCTAAGCAIGPDYRRPAVTQVPASAPSEPTPADRLAELARLRDDGILTDVEFTAAKRRLLGL